MDRLSRHTHTYAGADWKTHTWPGCLILADKRGRKSVTAREAGNVGEAGGGHAVLGVVAFGRNKRLVNTESKPSLNTV